jgi:hypothetical protein
MKVYAGTRRRNENVSVTVDGLRLASHFHLHNHSPAGFEWGYGGSGPAQLALAILANHFGEDEKALAMYQAFKWRVISKLPKNGWTLTSEEIDQALESL